MRGTPPVRPLFFEFPNEHELFGIDKQFLIGRDVLVTPVLTPNATSVSGIVPGHGAAVWRDWWTHAPVTAGNVTLPAPLGTINVHLRDGSALLLFAEPGYTTKETAEGPYELLVSVAKDGYAHGQAYVDDGISEPPTPSRTITFAASKGKLVIESEGKFKVTPKLEKVTVLGVAKPSKVWVGGKSVKYEYDEGVQRVVVSGVQVDLNKAATVTWQ
jgi:alpha-glucosidase